MTIADLMDHKRITLRELRRDMAGISPRHPLYQRWAEEATKLEKELAELGAQK